MTDEKHEPMFKFEKQDNKAAHYAGAIFDILCEIRLHEKWRYSPTNKFMPGATTSENLYKKLAYCLKDMQLNAIDPIELFSGLIKIGFDEEKMTEMEKSLGQACKDIGIEDPYEKAEE